MPTFLEIFFGETNFLYLYKMVFFKLFLVGGLLR
jgi:hypothetical protein